ncbi:MAG: trigger factor [Planctomycetaceae bacterium]|jgi:trigger factor|nr:trigger factor [Planctomycetaceae bacterium]MDG2388517.1 trigger factor [Planctomycetaceae bacterium]
MTDTPEEQLDVPDIGDAVAAVEVPEIYEMSLDVTIDQSGPCRKHVKVIVPRKDIDHHFEQTTEKFRGEADVPGFRPGMVPTQLIQKRFRKELGDQVKQDILLESLEQISEKHDLDPIDQPDLDLETLDLPEDGDFSFEFDVEVRPEFDLPDYSGLKLDRPSKEIDDAEIEKSLERYLSQYASFEDRDGAAEADDYVGLKLTAEHGGKTTREIDEFYIRVKPTLRFEDAELEGFDKIIVGTAKGDKVSTSATISNESANIEMRGEEITLNLEVLEVKMMKLPELDSDFLERIEMESADDLREAIKDSLDRQLKHEQRQSARKQVLEQITASADWDLPEKLVLNQTDNALRREMLEMQQAGYTTQQVRSRENEMRQKAVSETRQALKEHFVLDKIAEAEEIEVTPSDIESEIFMMAMQSGENPRRVRARLQKSGMIDNLEAQIRERKAVDIVLDQAEFKDVPTEDDSESDNVEAVRYSLCQSVTSAQTDEEEPEVEKSEE